MTNEVQPFRIALRQRGQWVKIYMARTETMDDAIFIGQIMTNALTMGGEEAREALIEFLKKIATGLMLVGAGEKPTRFDVHEVSGQEREQ